MVLKHALLLLFLPGLSWGAFDMSAFERAQKFSAKNQNVQALRILESSYNLNSRDLPVKISSFVAILFIAPMPPPMVPAVE